MSEFPYRSLVVSGGAGFIGSHFARLVTTRFPEVAVTVLDKLTYAGRRENLADLGEKSNFTFVQGDICDPEVVHNSLRGVEALVNFAAETHVDRSLLDSASFVRTDVVGVQVLLEAARQEGLQRMVQVSTDEVYGHFPEGLADEDTPLLPRSPYSASKAGGELLCRSYHQSFGLPVVITRGSNTYGPAQFPEKIIPLFLTNALDARPLPVYGDGSAVRDYIHVTDHCEGILVALLRGKDGEAYNLGGGEEVSGLEMARRIIALTGQAASLITHVQDRPGHDYRYAIDSTRLRGLGWAPQIGLDQGLADTHHWYAANRSWWEPLKSGEYLEYYRRVYGSQA